MLPILYLDIYSPFCNLNHLSSPKNARLHHPVGPAVRFYLHYLLPHTSPFNPTSSFHILHIFFIISVITHNLITSITRIAMYFASKWHQIQCSACHSTANKYFRCRTKIFIAIDIFANKYFVSDSRTSSSF